MREQKINKLTEDWWDMLEPDEQAAYIKAHPTSQKAQAPKEEPKEKPSDRYADVDTSWMDDPDAAAAQGQQGMQPGQDEPEGKKDAKGITRYTRKDAQGREYDAMTGKGKGKDSRNEPDDEEWYKSMMSRTGKELNQETLMIDGKQYRRINEVEQEPKSKYEFAEFYKRFKK